MDCAAQKRNWQAQPLEEQFIPEVIALWNTCCGPGKLVYRQLDEAAFRTLFIQSEPGVNLISKVILADGHVAGFAGGAYRDAAEQGYVTIVLVAENWRREGIGQTLLAALEEDLKNTAKGCLNRFEVMFFNPVTLSWIVPGSENDDHPNAPGVDVSCDGYLFLKNQGYRDIVYQNSYYQPLQHYAYPADIEKKLKELEHQGIQITLYDPERHTGLNELFDNLENEPWREVVMANEAAGSGRVPLIIVTSDNKVYGFTGPIRVEPSGRGYFAGIGVHTDLRGKGVGKALFSVLCMELKHIGASFMTLFTGETNPARNIYEAAGFKIVRTWADMKKELKA